MATLTIGVNATSIHQCPPHWQQYINKTFNFSFCFPRQAQLKDHFLSGYFISKAWTVMNNSRVLSVGHQVTSVNLINVDTSRHQLPATDSFLAKFIHKRQIQPSSFYYLKAAVHVGVSSSQHDVRQCYHPSAAQDKPIMRRINGRVFYVFKRHEVGMSQYLTANSYRYRTSHYCYAIEYIEIGGGVFDALGDMAPVSKFYANEAQQIISTLYFYK